MEGIRDVNELSQKSEIILYIHSHAEDTSEPLNPIHNNNLLMITLANKNAPSVCINNIYDFLKTELATNNRCVSDVSEDLTRDINTIFDFSNKCKTSIARLRAQHTVLDDEIVGSDVDRVNEILQKCSKINRDIASTEQFDNDICDGLAARARVIKNDRIYHKLKSVFKVLDIRYPKKQTQNNPDISHIINATEDTVILSDILRYCYDELGFDYVTIFDMGCRYCLNSEPIGTSEEEITDGDDALGRFKELKLGGKSSRLRTTSKYRKLRKHKSIKTPKYRKSKKSRKHKSIKNPK